MCAIFLYNCLLVQQKMYLYLYRNSLLNALRNATNYGVIAKIERIKMKTKKRPIIILPHGNRGRLAKELGVSMETVRKALKYITDSEEAIKIRKEALMNYNGVEVEVTIKS